ncbi:MAG TPA: hypothetical protein PKL41_07775 [Flavobacteriales bacterium]|nr:hypothetical protein [Flavobacteriales bacterium]HNA31995.1 hypothetical protein [Flavobacteriales bacterium]HNK85084.1 hypothetical protein [Flavobacteriales bacterium]HNM68929.1 hypothetical protein [Flavobacteriales bacterium]HNO04056.1 hypothetical protein [Flavobacteriales bacterium]
MNPTSERTWRIDADHGPGPVLVNRDLVPLRPALFNNFNCEHCGAPGPAPVRDLFIGIQILGEYACGSCGTRFFRDLPVGFQVDLPLAFTTEERRILHWNAEPWITYPEYAVPTDPGPRTERKVYREHDRIIVLNTLDHLYGHVLLKLYNAQHYLDHYKDRGLVVIVPRMFEWLVPKGVAETWVVDQKLSQARAWHPAIDRFVQEQLPRYKEVDLARGWGHPNMAGVDISRFTGVEPFPLDQYVSTAPHITFVARTDRLWFRTTLGKLCYRAIGALGLRNSLGRWFTYRQSAMMRSVMRRVKRALPDASFTVVGLAPSGGFEGLAEDLRTMRMDTGTELQWCRAYARSHIVVGVHGSNMLLPTAHAAGLIEILPRDRFGNFGQDVSIRYRDRMQLFLYRFVDEFADPGTVARNAVSMIRHFTVYHRNNITNTFGLHRTS